MTSYWLIMHTACSELLTVSWLCMMIVTSNIEEPNFQLRLSVGKYEYLQTFFFHGFCFWLNHSKGLHLCAMCRFTFYGCGLQTPTQRCVLNLKAIKFQDTLITSSRMKVCFVHFLIRPKFAIFCKSYFSKGWKRSSLNSFYNNLHKCNYKETVETLWNFS